MPVETGFYGVVVDQFGDPFADVAVRAVELVSTVSGDDLAELEPGSVEWLDQCELEDVATTVTDSAGGFELSNLPQAWYVVAVDTDQTVSLYAPGVQFFDEASVVELTYTGDWQDIGAITIDTEQFAPEPVDENNLGSGSTLPGDAGVEDAADLADPTAESPTNTPTQPAPAAVNSTGCLVFSRGDDAHISTAPGSRTASRYALWGYTEQKYLSCG
jgi:hypothetical protein